MYKLLSKSGIESVLPEKRAKVVFSNPDILIIFEKRLRFIIWKSILDSMNSNFIDHLTLWKTELDFGDYREDTSKVFKDYFTIELCELPKFDLNNNVDLKNVVLPFIHDLDGNVYINEEFCSDLKSAGCEDIWYDTTAPFGRY